MHVYDELVPFLKSRHVTRVEWKAGLRSYTDGFVVGLSDHLVAVLSILDFRSDGVEVSPLSRVAEVVTTSADGFWQHVLETEGLVPERRVLRGLQLGDYRALAESLHVRGRMVGVSYQPDVEGPVQYALGPVRATEDVRCAVQRVWASGAWDDEWTWIRFDTIERVDVDRPYVNAYERYTAPYEAPEA